MARRTQYDPDNRAMTFSRTALDDFIKCPRCFYLHRRLGISVPSGPMSGLPTVVDGLLKREFDRYRTAQEPHPLMVALPGDLVPFAHPDLDGWRKRSPGVRVLHEASGFEVTGALDDVWISRDAGVLHIVDYKTTSSADGPSTEVGDQYRRQIEIYQWLLRGNDLAVSPIGYLLYENADRTADSFDGVLRFAATVVPCEGDAAWIDEALVAARACLDADTPPVADAACKVCDYVDRVSAVER